MDNVDALLAAERLRHDEFASQVRAGLLRVYLLRVSVSDQCSATVVAVS